MNQRNWLTIGLACVALLPVTAWASNEPLGASRAAVALDKQIDWSRFRLMTVQDAGRYKTFTSFAREAFSAMYYAENLPGLSPEASALEWLFHRDAYNDAPVIYIRDKGLRLEFTTTMPDDRRERVLNTNRMTPKEFLAPQVQQRIEELEPKNTMGTAIRRVRDAQTVAQAFDRLLKIVPPSTGGKDDAWFGPEDLLVNLQPEVLTQIGVNPQALQNQRPIEGISSEQALGVVLDWAKLRTAWLNNDGKAVQENLDSLCDRLPKMAAAGVYPTLSQRKAEASYYQLGKFTWGWMLYFAGILVSIWAVVTGWKLPRYFAITFLLAALFFHGYGVGLRWYILGRIPIANMFEAVIGSAWLGVLVGFALELIYKQRVFLLAANALGFAALIIGGYVIPGGGNITTIMGILDDIMLRIHTLMIIWSYALIFLAAVIAVVYLLGYYFRGSGGVDVTALGPLASGFMSGGAAADLRMLRPIAAGDMPGDEGFGNKLPLWLHQLDWCHLIILNLVFVMLFVGTILGAVWADYSWGRPWGWDPKEVFALNTWLVYAILIHVRFFVKNRGLWTAWLSVAGCAMMAFNWCFVNFFIVGLHSYA